MHMQRFMAIIISGMLLSSYPLCSFAQEMPPLPPALPLETESAPAPIVKQSTPSNEMDFVLPRDATAGEAVPSSPPAPQEGVQGGLLGEDDTAPTVDQFFSNTKVIAPEPTAEIPVASPDAIIPLQPIEEDKKKKEEEEKEKKKAEKKKKPALPPYNYKNVRLPETIYHRPNSRDNKHLPVAFTQKDQQYLLAQAVVENDVAEMRALVKNGANPRISVQSIPLLVMAAREGNVDAARWLLQQGVSVNEADSQGFTALHYASYAKNASLISLLKLYKADAGRTDDYARAGHGNPLMARQLPAAR